LEINRFFAGLLGFPLLKPPSPYTSVYGYAETLSTIFARDGRLHFRSRNSAGTTRVSVHTREMLREEAEAASLLFSGAKRVLSAVLPASSFGFVFGVLIPKLLRIPALDVAASPALSGAGLRKGDLVILFPQLLKKLTVVPPPEATLLCSATPPLDDHLFKAAVSVGFSALIEVYGTSVTGALGYRGRGGPYELFPHFRRRGEKDLERRGTGEKFRSRSLQWRGERSFGHFNRGESG
jgi:hypothetical protein